jgi:hypothetical protein
MAFRTTKTAALVAVLLLGGCSFASEALFPSLAPEADADGSSTSSNSTAADGDAAAAQPGLGTSSFNPPTVTAGQPTGTFVGQKVISLRDDLTNLQATLSSQNDQLQQIRSQTVEDSQRYHGTVAAIEARLQVGTTPGNPILVEQWNEAQGELDRINDDVLMMNRLTTDVASTSGMAAYLLESVRAARSLSGAVDEDHRQLRTLEDETNGTTVLIERLLTELSNDAQRQQQYISNERGNLNTLALAIKNGQLYGSSLGIAQGGAPLAPAYSATATPLVVIRFDRPNVAYENALYTAAKGALARRPNAVFEVVAVSPPSGSPGSAALAEAAAHRNADAVVRSLTQMGLPQDRIRVSATTNPSASNGEVQVFIR